MASNYTGTPYPPPGQDAPQQPLPGAAPIVTIPGGADAATIASLTQLIKSGADFGAFVQKSLVLAPPQLPAANLGFTPVSHVGAGTGTVTPTTVSSTVQQAVWSPVSCVVKISTAGVAGGGVAQYQWSTNGGVTYGAPKALPNGNDTNGSITVTFAGTFTLNDTYAFQPALQPIAIAQDAGGYKQFLIDPYGYPMGDLAVFDEQWDWNSATLTSTTANDGDTFEGGRWQIKTSAAGAGSYLWQVDAQLHVPVLTLRSTITNATKAWFQTQNARFAGPGFGSKTDGIVVAEWWFKISVSANQRWLMGFFDSNTDPNFDANSKCCFYTDNGGHWFASSQLAGDVDTGIAPIFNQWNKFRIVMAGATSTLGGVVGGAALLYFIGDNLVALQTGSAPFTSASVAAKFGWYVKNNAGVADVSGSMSPFRIVQNRAYP